MSVPAAERSTTCHPSSLLSTVAWSRRNRTKPILSFDRDAPPTSTVLSFHRIQLFGSHDSPDSRSAVGVVPRSAGDQREVWGAVHLEDNSPMDRCALHTAKTAKFRVAFAKESRTSSLSYV